MPAMPPFTLADTRARLPLPDADLVPLPGAFLHDSAVHGQLHVARVLVHALHLIAATGFVEETRRLWAAVYLHDLARLHDGRCARHGADAWARLQAEPELQAVLARGGVSRADYEAVAFAITIHSSGEPEGGHPHYRLAALLKDADGLDRVRLNDLKIRMLRHQQARALVPFAQRLYDETTRFAPGPDLFHRVWAVATRADATGGVESLGA
jgi:hypothetical protein